MKRRFCLESGAVAGTVASDLSVSLWLRFFSKVLVFATIALIFMGALVTSHNAGLAVPDWPTTWGENMFLYPPSKWVGNIFFEHGHRLIASCVGLLTVILVLSLWRLETRAWVRKLGYISLLAVILQGILGGVTVLYFLPTPVSVAHAVLGQTFFVATIIIAYVQSKEFENRIASTTASPSTGILKLSLFFVGLVYLQLILGATMRHTGSGLAIPDFPSMGGSYLPWFNHQAVAAINELRAAQNLWPIEHWQVLLHFSHRAMAFLIMAFVAYLMFKVLRAKSSPRSLRSSAQAILYLTIFQFLFGVFTVLSAKAPYLTSVHVALGAATLGFGVIFALRAAPFEKQGAK